MNLIKDKKVLVTGANGFIGKNLTLALVSEGAKVRVLLRNKENSTFFNKIGVKIFFGDLTKPSTLNTSLKNVDIVFNLAGALPHHKLTPEEYWNTNVNGVKNLMSSSISQKVKRVVHVSTVGIYGEISDSINERSKPNPQSIYSKSKLEGEKAVLAYKKSPISYSIIRPTLAYGPFDTRPGFFDLFKFIHKGFFVPIGNGDNYFHTVYVGNLIQALMLAATKKSAHKQDFIIGDDPCPKIRDFWTDIATAFNRRLPPFYIPKPIAYLISYLCLVLSPFGFPRLLNNQRVNFITSSKRYKIAKAKTVLGYKPTVDITEGIHQTITWYKDNRYF